MQQKIVLNNYTWSCPPFYFPWIDIDWSRSILVTQLRPEATFFKHRFALINHNIFMKTNRITFFLTKSLGKYFWGAYIYILFSAGNLFFGPQSLKCFWNFNLKTVNIEQSILEIVQSLSYWVFQSPSYEYYIQKLGLKLEKERKIWETCLCSLKFEWFHPKF